MGREGKGREEGKGGGERVYVWTISFLHLCLFSISRMQTGLLWDRLAQTFLFSDVIAVECLHYANRTARGPYGLGVDSAYPHDASVASMAAVAALCPSLQQVTPFYIFPRADGHRIFLRCSEHS